MILVTPRAKPAACSQDLFADQISPVQFVVNGCAGLGSVLRLQKSGEPESSRGTAFRVVQLRVCSRFVTYHTRDAGWTRGSRMVCSGTNWIDDFGRLNLGDTAPPCLDQNL